jgi:hypothetical protein
MTSLSQSETPSHEDGDGDEAMWKKKKVSKRKETKGERRVFLGIIRFLILET